MVPRTVLTRSGLISLNAARPVNTVQPRTAVNNAGPMKNVINNAYSTARRPFNKITAANNSNFNKRVNTVNNKNVNAARPNAVVNTARPKAVLSSVKGNKGNTIKASACWVWRPKHKVLDHGNPQQDLKDNGVIDSGCSRHMTGNRSYLTYYEEIDGGFVAFRGNSKGGKITGKVPRKDNIYSVDLNNIIPQGGLTYLFVKATPDESNLWHRRLGHVNFKTMNKLVNRNLVRGLPSKLFEINQTCVACQKEKQHRASYHLGKFDGNADEGFFIGYSTNSKAFRVFNSRTKIVEENMHVKFSEDTPNIARSGPNWLFDIDALINSMKYKPVVTGNQSNGNASTKACDNLGKARMETIPGKDYILLPFSIQDPPFFSSSKDYPNAGFKPSGEEEKKDAKDLGNEDSTVPSTKEPKDNQEKDASVNSTNTINTISPTINTAGIKDNVVDENIVYGCDDDPNMLELEEIVYSDDDEDVGAEADINNLDTHILVSPIATTRIHKDHSVEQNIGDIYSTPQSRRMTKKDPKKVVQALKDPSWIEAMQEELLQFKIEAIRLFLAYASFKDFVVYQMDVKSAFLYGKIKEEVYVCQPSGFEDPDFPNRVYKVEKAFYGLHQAPRAWYETLSTYLLDNGFQRRKLDKTLFIKRDKGLQVKQKEDGIFISQDKYVTEILKKFSFSDVKTASTPIETYKPLLKDADGQPKLGLWYPKDLPFDLVAYTNSDYEGASLDRNSTTRGCQFLRCRLISWQCKKQTVVANSTTKAEYIAASNCCRQIRMLQIFLQKHEKNLIQMIKIHTDQNVADLLTKAFDVSRFEYLIASIGMLNL
ncbi:putative ribonuclease H-like domain-containing protein [Tanacetum coccineum]